VLRGNKAPQMPHGSAPTPQGDPRQHAPPPSGVPASQPFPNCLRR
jgi:hypothetical protein